MGRGSGRSALTTGIYGSGSEPGNNRSERTKALCRVLAIKGSGEKNGSPMNDQTKSLDERDEMFDFAVPPAPVDVHDFARHAGEIIARAALGESKRNRDVHLVRRCA